LRLISARLIVVAALVAMGTLLCRGRRLLQRRDPATNGGATSADAKLHL
jgi:hypothetical protein